jgi:hypothetical protein
MAGEIPPFFAMTTTKEQLLPLAKEMMAHSMTNAQIAEKCGIEYNSYGAKLKQLRKYWSVVRVDSHRPVRWKIIGELDAETDSMREKITILLKQNRLSIPQLRGLIGKSEYCVTYHLRGIQEHGGLKRERIGYTYFYSIT